MNRDSFDDHESGGIYEKIGAYVDGELPADERDAIAAELSGNPELAEAARSYRWLDDAAALEQTPEVSSSEWSTLLQSVTSEADPAGFTPSDATPTTGETRVLRPQFRLAKYAAAAAALGIAAWLAVAALDKGGVEAPEGSAVVEAPADAAPSGEEIDRIAETPELESGEEPDEVDGGLIRYTDF